MLLRSLLLIAFLVAPTKAAETDVSLRRGLQNGKGVKARVSRLEDAVGEIYNTLSDVKDFVYDNDFGFIERLSSLEASYKQLQEDYECLRSSGFHVNHNGELVQYFQCYDSAYSYPLGNVVGPPGPPGKCSCHPDDRDEDNESDDIGEITVLRSCRAYYDAGFTYDGFYAIDPDGPNNGVDPFKVWCDQTTTIETSAGVAVTGGWTLFANHKHGQKPKKNIKDTVYPEEFSVSTDEHWAAIRDTMDYGMMFIDEFNQTSAISKDILEAETNCRKPSDSPSLVGDRNRVLVWIEDDCNGDEEDYCGVTLTSNRFTGAALFGYCGVDVYDTWPYDSGVSFNEQKQLKYFVG